MALLTVVVPLLTVYCREGVNRNHIQFFVQCPLTMLKYVKGMDVSARRPSVSLFVQCTGSSSAGGHSDDPRLETFFTPSGATARRVTQQLTYAGDTVTCAA